MDVARGKARIAAALAGSLLAALALVAFAPASGRAGAANVTLQVAPRGLGGTVTVNPPGLNSDGQTQAGCSGDTETASCTLTYNRGQSVTLTGSGTQGRTLASWSTPDCPGTGACTVKLDDDAISVVALFNPLRLGIVLSSPDGHVTADPAGTPCPDQEIPGNADQCFRYRPGTVVKLTMVTDAHHTFKGWNGACAPVDQPTCTVTVLDEPTWVGAYFDNDSPPGLATTISVQFRLQRTGSGSGRVTGAKLDCGTVCTSQYDYGKQLSLSVAPDGGSTFDGWNGVCAKTQTTCTFPVGPVTAIRASFARDATAPGSPGALAVSSSTKTAIAIGWAASTDNVGVTGYRLYLDGTAAADTTTRQYTFTNLSCGRSYTVAVDATDAAGNRSAQTTLTTQTQPCALAARLAGLAVVRSGTTRTVVVRLRVNRPTSARLTLRRSGRPLAGRSFTVVPGTNLLRLAVPRGVRRGPCMLAIALTNPDGGILALPSRAVLVPSPK